MMDGFDYFDGNHRENFCAGLILLCLDEDQNFCQRFAELVRKCLEVPYSVPLNDWGREASLDAEQGKRLRSDIWLKFGEQLYLIEVKTHSNWNPDEVVQQVHDQSKSKIREQLVHGVALLAPTSLLGSIRSEQVRKLSWSDVLALVSEQPSRILSLARDQWRCNVEADFGLDGPAAEVSVGSMQQLASQAGCLKAFLLAALVCLGGHPSYDALHPSRPDGQPHRKDGWGWFGVAVSGQLQGFGRVLLGVFTYVECPKGSESNLGMWLEVYRWRSWSDPLSSIRFDPPDLTHKSLAKVLDTFLVDFTSKYRQK